MGFFWSYVSKVRIKLELGRGPSLYGSPQKIGLAEPKKRPHKVPFWQNITLRGLSGVLRHSALEPLPYSIYSKVEDEKYCDMSHVTIRLSVLKKQFYLCWRAQE